jgi:DNA polymerase-3 subunit delta'
MNLLLHQTVQRSVERAARRAGGSALLHGSDGVGKRTVALEIARRLNCQGCEGGQCHSCVMLRAGHHPDVVMVVADDKGKIGIEAVQQLQHQFVYGSYESASRRVAIIVDAERLTLPAQNALLKTLEEPPIGTTVILTAVSPVALLETIVSRCRTIYIPRLGQQAIADYIQAQGVAKGQLAGQAARLSDGAVGTALSYASDATKLAQRQAVDQKVQELTQAPSSFERLIAAIGIAKQTDQLPSYLDGLTAWARQAARQPGSDGATNLAAVERLRLRLGANVSPKVAFNALATEVAC